MYKNVYYNIWHFTMPVTWLSKCNLTSVFVITRIEVVSLILVMMPERALIKKKKHSQRYKFLAGTIYASQLLIFKKSV